MDGHGPVTARGHRPDVPSTGPGRVGSLDARSWTRVARGRQQCRPRPPATASGMNCCRCSTTCAPAGRAAWNAMDGLPRNGQTPPMHCCPTLRILAPSCPRSHRICPVPPDVATCWPADGAGRPPVDALLHLIQPDTEAGEARGATHRFIQSAKALRFFLAESEAHPEWTYSRSRGRKFHPLGTLTWQCVSGQPRPISG